MSLDYEIDSFADTPSLPQMCGEQGCFRAMHPESEGGFCAGHELKGYAEELKRKPNDLEMLAFFAKWVVLTEREAR